MSRNILPRAAEWLARVLPPARKALVASWPILKTAYLIAFRLWWIVFVLLVASGALVDRTFGPAARVILEKLAEYLGWACGLVVNALVALPVMLGVPAAALVAAFILHGLVKAAVALRT